MTEEQKPVLIALAGPKGGVGKSCLSLNLAAALAARYPGTVLADLDLGGANLHALMGLGGLGPGIQEFINDKAELAGLLCQTPVEGLRILPGSADALGLSNLLQWQKVKLINHLKTLPAGLVVADLGAGSTYNTLDFFDSADLGILVLTPEMTSALNTYSFIKSLLHRRLLTLLKPKKYKAAREYLEQALKGSLGNDPGSLPGIVSGVAELDAEAAELMEKAVEDRAPRLILNMVDHPKQAKVAEALDRLAQRRLGLRLDLLGQVPYDPRLRLSVCRMKPLFLEEPDSPSGLALAAVAEGLEGLLPKR